MKKIEYRDNKLIADDFEVIFKHKIAKIECAMDVCLVLIELPKGSKEVDNLYGVDMRGNILWKVQSVKDAFNIPQNTPYIALKLIDAKKVQVISFFGMRFTVDVLSGKLIDKECMGW